MESPSPARGTLRFAAFEVDLRAGELRKSGRRIKLQEQPFQILQLLLERPGELVTREELRNRIWSADTFVDFDHGLYNAIKRLREALGDSSENPVYVETLAKRGYRFLAPVEVVSASAFSFGPPPAPAPALNLARVRLGLAIAAVAVLVALAGALTRDSVERLWGRVKAAPRGPVIRSLAVLPFRNLSGDTSQEYFADGMTEELIINLSRIHSLRVISRTSVMPYKENRKSLAGVAKELGVDAVVEGAVQRSGDQVRITARLVYAPEDKNLWAQSYERRFPDILAVQSQIAQEIAASIHAEVSTEEREAFSTSAGVDPRAYDAYLKGDQYWARFTDDDWRKSKQYFEEAIQIDPKYARAYSALAGVLLGLGWKGNNPPNLQRIQSLAEKALELDPSLDDPHIMLGWVHLRKWDLAASENEFSRAAELAPNNAHGLISYYNVLLINHKLPRPVPDFLHLGQGSPNSPDVLSAFGSFLVFAGEPDRAAEVCRGAISLQPDFAFAHYCLGRALMSAGKPEQGIPELQLAAQKGGDIMYFHSHLAQAYAMAGKKRDALQAIRELESRPEADRDYQIALVYSRLDDRAKTLQMLEQAYAKHNWELIYMGVDPALESFRSDPRFRSIMKRVGLPL